MERRQAARHQVEEAAVGAMIHRVDMAEATVTITAIKTREASPEAHRATFKLVVVAAAAKC